MKSGFLLDVVIRQSTAIFQLLASENQTLLIRGDSFLVLNLSLHILNGVRRLDIKGDGLTRQCLHKNLHTTTQTQYKMKSGFLLDVVIRQCTAIFQLLASEN